MLITRNEIDFQVSDNSLYQSFWNWNEWESATYDNIKKFSNKEKIFIDIGAWIGPITLYAAKLNRVYYAFEPDPIAYAELQSNVITNKLDNVHTYNLAISDTVGYINMGTVELGNSMTRIGYDSNSFSVETTTISKFFVDNNINKDDVGLIKIDVEGAELDILNDEFFNDIKIPVHLSVHTPFFKNESDINKILTFVNRYDNKIETQYPHGFFDVMVY